MGNASRSSKAASLEHDALFYVFAHRTDDTMAVHITDKKGFARVQRCIAAQWQETVSCRNELVSKPNFYLCKKRRIPGYRGIASLEQLMAIMTSELLGTAPEKSILLVAARN